MKTQTSSVLGTAHYISPEQAQGKELDGTSDMYSLGCVLYEAATGQLPFDGPDAVSVAMRQVNEAPVPPSQINPDIQPDLEAIILKAMEKNPVNRFRTAREMKHALDDFLMGRPVNLGEGINSAATQVMNNVVPPISNADIPGGTAVMPAHRHNTHNIFFMFSSLLFLFLRSVRKGFCRETIASPPQI